MLACSVSLCFLLLQLPLLLTLVFVWCFCCCFCCCCCNALFAAAVESWWWWWGICLFVCKLRIQESIYPVILEDWLRVIPREQILFIRFEDFASNMTQDLMRVHQFLGLREYRKSNNIWLYMTMQADRGVLGPRSECRYSQYQWCGL